MILARGKSVVLYGMVGAALLALAVTAYMGTAQKGAGQGELLPQVELSDLAGNGVTTADLAGKPLVLRFSSLGCSHCAEDFQWLNALATQYPDLQVVAVQVEDDAGAVTRALGGYKPIYPILLDPGGDAAKAFGLRGYPTWYFVDDSGVLAGSFWGEAHRQPGQMEFFLNLLLDKVEEG